MTLGEMALGEMTISRQISCFGELLSEISSICKIKMPQIKLTLTVEKFEVFVDFDAISVHFPKDFDLRSNTIN